MKNLFAIFALAGAIATWPAAGSASGVCDDELTIGWEPWPPFEMSGDNGLEGINPDLHRAIAEKTGCTVRFVEIPWKRLLRNVEQGETDIANTASKTPERAEFANFSAPYLDYQAILFTSTKDTRSYKSLESFLKKGNLLGVSKGYSYGDNADTLIKKEIYANKISRQNSPELSIRMVAAGRLDGTIGNRFVMSFMAKENNIRDKVRATNTVVQSDQVHFMFSKKSVPQKVIDAMNEALAELKAEGRVQDIIDRYTAGAS